jgi:hypothetical protein
VSSGRDKRALFIVSDKAIGRRVISEATSLEQSKIASNIGFSDMPLPSILQRPPAFMKTGGIRTTGGSRR